MSPPAAVPLLALTFQGSTQDIAAAGPPWSLPPAWGGELLDRDLAAAEWQERFQALRLKRAGPTVLGAESWLPLEHLAGYERDVAALAAAQRLPVATYGTVVRPGWATVMSLILAMRAGRSTTCWR